MHQSRQVRRAEERFTWKRLNRPGPNKSARAPRPPPRPTAFIHVMELPSGPGLYRAFHFTKGYRSQRVPM